MLNFFLGMMFAYILLPILESLMAVICTGLEVIKAKYSVKITEYNSKISQINQGLEPPTAYPIGFQYIPVEEDEEEYED